MTTIEVKIECLRKAIEVAPTARQDNNQLSGIQYYNGSKNPKTVLDIAKQFYIWVDEK